MKTTPRAPASPKPRSRRRPRRAPLRAQPPPGIEPPRERIVAAQRSEEMIVWGTENPWFGDFYHQTLTVPWWVFLTAVSGVYLGANVVFALLYLIAPGSLAHAEPGSFWDCFFFSVQTIATIGYGVIAPANFYGNLIVTLETVFGLMLFAVSTGLVFARFSRPTARIVFSRVAVVGPYDGVPTLSLRLANERRNQILEAQVSVTLVRDELTREGSPMRRFYDLSLARTRTPIFSMTFTVMHPIDQTSPLWGSNAASMLNGACELVVTVTGLDETTLQPVHGRTSYLAGDVLFNHRFVDVIGWTDDGRRAIDYRRFHDAEPLPEG